MKKRFNIQRFTLFFWSVLFTIQMNSQDLFTKELRWTPRDSIKTLIFQDKDQILKWSYDQLPFPSVSSKDILINGFNFYITIVSGCSGLPCWRIFIFKEKDEHWRLIASTDARLTEKIEIEVDNNLRKIKFKTKSHQIGELPFGDLILDPN
jgi:hypothetical protein